MQRALHLKGLYLDPGYFHFGRIQIQIEENIVIKSPTSNKALV